MEITARDLSRIDPVSFAVSTTDKGPPALRYQRYGWLHKLSRTLAAARYGFGPKKIVISVPPRHGKSELISKWFPLWCLDQDPYTRIILTSYSASLAAKFGGQVRDLADTHRDNLTFARPQTGERHDWRTGHGEGGLFAAGVDGGATGRGADVILIDDPVKNAKEAESASRRQSVWDWYETTIKTRLEPGGIMIVVMTRWHHDDLAGRLLSRYPEEWTEIKLKALAGEDDPLGRAPGEALCPERYSVADLEAIRESTHPRWWAALYQQEPSLAEGDIFRKAWFRYFEVASGGDYVLADGTRISPADCTRVSSVDLATSERTTADYFVISTWDIAPNGSLLLLDVVRERVPGPQQIPLLREVWSRWRASQILVESVGYQLSLVQSAIKEGLPIIRVDTRGDKVARGTMGATRYLGGAVFHNRAMVGLDLFETELLQFPTGAHDDQVDTMSQLTIAIAEGRIVASRKGLGAALDAMDQGRPGDGYGFFDGV